MKQTFLRKGTYLLTFILASIFLCYQCACAETRSYRYEGNKVLDYNFSTPDWSLTKDAYIDILKKSSVRYVELLYDNKKSLILFNGYMFGYCTGCALYFNADNTIDHIEVNGINDSMIASIAVLSNQLGIPDIVYDPFDEHETGHDSYYMWELAIWTYQETAVYVISNDAELYYRPYWDDGAIEFDIMESSVSISVYPASTADEWRTRYNSSIFMVWNDDSLPLAYWPSSYD